MAPTDCSRTFALATNFGRFAGTQSFEVGECRSLGYICAGAAKNFVAVFANHNANHCWAIRDGHGDFDYGDAAGIDGLHGLPGFVAVCGAKIVRCS